jgi:hypothetical protein
VLYHRFCGSDVNTGGPSKGAVSASKISSSGKVGCINLSPRFLPSNGRLGAKDSASASISAKFGSAMMCHDVRGKEEAG